MRKVPLAPDVDAKVIARGTPGFSGADLANLVNEAALLAARRGKRFVTMGELEDAKDKVMMGSERRSMAMTEEEKKLTAYHEAGHALVALSVPKTDPVHKVTIIPRGRALGLTMQLPERDKYGMSLIEMQSRLAILFGGRVAEEMIFGPENVTTGAGGDIQQATALARRMVTEFGMSEKLGRVRYNANEQEVFLGHSVTQQQNISETTADLIDSEVRRLIEEGETSARRILGERQAGLHAIAKGLLEFESLSGDEIGQILRGEAILRPDDDEPPRSTGRRSSVPSSGARPEGGGLRPEPQPGA
jgi:cell division protease FtsH